MATILPGSPPGYSKEDMSGTVRAVCGYLRTMHDNVDFQLGQMIKRMDSLTQRQAAFESRIKTVETASATTLEAIAELEARVTALEGEKGEAQ